MRDPIEAAFYEGLGSRIKAERKRRRVSQIRLAQISGVHRNTLLRWEKGDPIDLRSFLLVAQGMDCAPSALISARDK